MNKRPKGPNGHLSIYAQFNSAPDTSLMVHKFFQFLACFVKYSLTDENIKTQIFTILTMYGDGEILVKSNICLFADTDLSIMVEGSLFVMT